MHQPFSPCPQQGRFSTHTSAIRSGLPARRVSIRTRAAVYQASVSSVGVFVDVSLSKINVIKVNGIKACTGTQTKRGPPSHPLTVAAGANRRRRYAGAARRGTGPRPHTAQGPAEPPHPRPAELLKLDAVNRAQDDDENQPHRDPRPQEDLVLSPAPRTQLVGPRWCRVVGLRGDN